MKPMRTKAFLALIAGMALASCTQGMKGEMHKETTSMGTTSMTTTPSGTMQVVTVDSMNLHSADQLIGTEVRDNTGQQIGEVKDLMVNFEKGRVGYAVVSSPDGQNYLVPLSAFSSTHEGNFVTLNTDRSTLSSAPHPQPGMTEEEYGRRLHQHFGLGYVWSDLPGDVPVRQEDVPGSNLTYPGPRPVIPSEGTTAPGTTGGGAGTETR